MLPRRKESEFRIYVANTAAGVLGYCLGDLASVKAAILDENFVGVHAGHEHAGQVDTLPLAFERIGVRIRALGLGLECDAVRARNSMSGR